MKKQTNEHMRKHTDGLKVTLRIFICSCLVLKVLFLNMKKNCMPESIGKLHEKYHYKNQSIHFAEK